MYNFVAYRVLTNYVCSKRLIKHNQFLIRIVAYRRQALTFSQYKLYINTRFYRSIYGCIVASNLSSVPTVIKPSQLKNC